MSPQRVQPINEQQYGGSFNDIYGSGQGQPISDQVSPELRTIRENGDMGSIKECGGNGWKVNDWKQF